MTNPAFFTRYLINAPRPFLQRPPARLQPVLARDGKPNVDIARLAQILEGTAVLNETIPVRSPEHWQSLIAAVDDSIDAILPFSIAGYPTEVWNSHPQALVDRGLPVVFWSLLDHEEPDFWRLAARDLLRTLGVEVYIVQNNHEGLALLRALAVRRFLRGAKMVVFGEQNFPWNARAVGGFLTSSLGVELVIRPIADIQARYDRFSDALLDSLWKSRRGSRYVEKGVTKAWLRQALRSYLAIREILEEEQALGFGVNCFGDLIIQGGRDVPCLAQLLLREEGYIAACDGDFIAMAGMLLATHFLDRPSMTSNLYPVAYTGALSDHFGDPLSPGESFPRADWGNLARLAHCGFVGVVSPEMTTEGQVYLRDWGGTYEIQRDGWGCGIDASLAAGQPITVFSLNFRANRLMVTTGCVAETTRHTGMPHCESSALVELRNLKAFFDNVSRDHLIVVYGDAVRELEILSGVLGLEFALF